VSFTAAMLFQMSAIAADVAGQIDRICRDHCEILAIQDGQVKLMDQWPPVSRTVDLGKHASGAQGLIPRTEAAVHDLRSPHGWRIVASVYMNHQDDEVSAHVRFVAPDGRLLATEDALELVESLEIGTFTQGADEIIAFTSEEEHSYNDQTELWCLPVRGKPKLVLAIPGAFERFTADGAVIARQTYDGVNADTKGIVDERYSWDRRSQSMIAQKQKR
jgi:hypothetical protein